MDLSYTQWRDLLRDTFAEVIQVLDSQQQQIEVLTTERDNALLRAEIAETRVGELEGEANAETEAAFARGLQAGWADCKRGGIAPND
jgi:hypothetical protein